MKTIDILHKETKEVIFSYTCKDNTVKKTVEYAVELGVSLNGADLHGADLREADLREVDLSEADLNKANLYGADLSESDLSEADLSDSDLRGTILRGTVLCGAELHRADLWRADLSRTMFYLKDLSLDSPADTSLIVIKKFNFFRGLYLYDCKAFISTEDEIFISLGCFTRKLSDWERDFWNNVKEFPNDGKVRSNLRLLAFNTLKSWVKIVNV